MSDTTPRPLLTVNQIAEYLNVDRATVYRLEVPYVLVGARRRYRLEDVDAWLFGRTAIYVEDA